MFDIEATDGEARAGRLYTTHRAVETPAFMPVATLATVKTLDSVDVERTGAQMLIANSFLLSLRPGVDIVREAGGLHGYMNWPGAAFTDSGGFQFIRRNFLVKLDDDGATLRSPYDGSHQELTPERCMEVQEALGPDVAMVLDHCPPYPCTTEEARESMARTHAWAGRCKAAHTRKHQALFAITQGGFDAALRRESAEFLAALDFDGYGIGGLRIGEPTEVTREMVAASVSALPEDKPRYLMGVGAPLDILDAIEMGVDVFDSVFPTRNARHGTVLTASGQYNLRFARHGKDLSALEEGCECPTCQGYTKAYLSHLMKNKELAGMRLLSIHNLWFTQRLVKGARSAIKEGTFGEYREGFGSGR